MNLALRIVGDENYLGYLQKQEPWQFDLTAEGFLAEVKAPQVVHSSISTIESIFGKQKAPPIAVYDVFGHATEPGLIVGRREDFSVPLITNIKPKSEHDRVRNAIDLGFVMARVSWGRATPTTEGQYDQIKEKFETYGWHPLNDFERLHISVSAGRAYVPENLQELVSVGKQKFAEEYKLRHTDAKDYQIDHAFAHTHRNLGQANLMLEKLNLSFRYVHGKLQNWNVIANRVDGFAPIYTHHLRTSYVQDAFISLNHTEELETANANLQKKQFVPTQVIKTHNLEAYAKWKANGGSEYGMQKIYEFGSEDDMMPRVGYEAVLSRLESSGIVSVADAVNFEKNSMEANASYLFEKVLPAMKLFAQGK